jgi:hypothetical protein
MDEMLRCGEKFYSVSHVMARIWGNLVRWRKPFITAVANFSYRGNLRLDRKAYAEFRREHGHKFQVKSAK